MDCSSSSSFATEKQNAASTPPMSAKNPTNSEPTSGSQNEQPWSTIPYSGATKLKMRTSYIKRPMQNFLVRNKTERRKICEMEPKIKEIDKIFANIWNILSDGEIDQRLKGAKRFRQPNLNENPDKYPTPRNRRDKTTNSSSSSSPKALGRSWPSTQHGGRLTEMCSPQERKLSSSWSTSKTFTPQVINANPDSKESEMRFSNYLGEIKPVLNPTTDDVYTTSKTTAKSKFNFLIPTSGIFTPLIKSNDHPDNNELKMKFSGLCQLIDSIQENEPNFCERPNVGVYSDIPPVKLTTTINTENTSNAPPNSDILLLKIDDCAQNMSSLNISNPANRFPELQDSASVSPRNS